MKYCPEKTILVDFDGTLAPFTWPKEIGEPYKGVVAFMKGLKAKGFKLVIFTARAWSGWDEVVRPGYRAEQVEEVAQWLRDYDIPFDYITNEKEPCLFIIDDRALPTNLGTWNDLFNTIVLEAANGTYGKHRAEEG